MKVLREIDDHISANVERFFAAQRQQRRLAGVLLWLLFFNVALAAFTTVLLLRLG